MNENTQLPGSIRVLIVDDEEAIRRNFRVYLEDSGYQVQEAVDGAAGLELFTRDRQDIVMTDLRMRAHRDGLGLVSAVHQLSPDTPVVVVSGSGTLDDAIDSIRVGAWDYMVKPVQCAEEMIVVIQRNLERARLLRENRLYRERLESLVQERTRSLAEAERENRELQARIMQSQKLESLGLLAGGIAHDFNNLLTSVTFGAEMVRQTSGNEAQAGLKLIESGTRRAAELTRQIFVFAGRAPAISMPCDISALVREMQPLIDVAITGTQFNGQLAQDLPMIQANPVQLRQVVMNLATNAAEAMNHGGAIMVRTGVVEQTAQAMKSRYFAETAAPGTYVFLVVEDTGEGMTEETRRRIFDPFFTTKQRGQGLGLTTVIGIVRGLNGAMEVDSEPGKGTRFTILFPTAQAIAEPETPRSILDVQSHILVIDSDAKTQNETRSLLESAGLPVTITTSLAEAVAAVRAQPTAFDAVLTSGAAALRSDQESFARLLELCPELHYLVVAITEDDKAWTAANSHQRVVALRMLTPQEIKDALAANLSRGAGR